MTLFSKCYTWQLLKLSHNNLNVLKINSFFLTVTPKRLLWTIVLYNLFFFFLTKWQCDDLWSQTCDLTSHWETINSCSSLQTNCSKLYQFNSRSTIQKPELRGITVPTLPLTGPGHNLQIPICFIFVNQYYALYFCNNCVIRVVL